MAVENKIIGIIGILLTIVAFRFSFGYGVITICAVSGVAIVLILYFTFLMFDRKVVLW